MPAPYSSMGAITLLLVLTLAASPAWAYRYTVFLPASTTWAAPAGATDISTTLWGGGGGAAVSGNCGAGGGSGSAVLNRTVNTAGWGLAPSDAQWIITVGQGGAALPLDGGTGGQASDGGETSVVVLAPNGTQLYGVVAYGGGGAKAVWPATTGCQGGAGGGASSSATGTIPGGGTPAGAADSDPLAAPAQGAIVGDVKAGGAGAGYGHANGNLSSPFLNGASWTSPGRHWDGGKGVAFYGRLLSWCYAWGGAAGFNGNAGEVNSAGTVYPPPANSGSGGSSAVSCGSGSAGSNSAAGAAGGVIIEYNHPVGPTPSSSVTPSRTPSTTPTRSPTSSVTPTPSAQPLSQLVTLVSPISGKQLTPQEDGSVASLWVGASYKEKWTVARLSNGKYTFRGFNGKYLGANPGGWVRAEATTVGSWEQWDVLINAGNQWTLKSVHGTYMGTTVAGVVYLNDNASLYWTKTTV
ncbi:Fascin-like incomplete domain containing protein [Pandoravirus celtis]|uniref:Fascin-like incomplete domain containing protein n=1 Tax=Pandoravirus celtis TaxID=2568002 RepID=A0A4D6EK32_9VIRU|nr:Fascin-like incomplete domain containing protein [Pandoravirus celtis]